MEEIWKDIEGYEGLYQVSNLGRVKSFMAAPKTGNKSEYIMGQTLITGGYLTVYFCVNGKRSKRQVHRLVAQAFIPNPSGLPFVNHKDENKTNNVVDNLEWCTSEYNANYGTSIQRARETRENKPKPIIQMNSEGEIIAIYKSPKIASILLKKNVKKIRSWIEIGHGEGYKWEYL